MQITVRLFATLRTNRFKEETFHYPAGTQVRKVVEDLKIPPKELALVLVNGQNASLDHVLTEGDILSLFPPVGGG